MKEDCRNCAYRRDRLEIPPIKKMTNYQKSILSAQEQALKRESDRYFEQKHRLDKWPWLRKKVLGSYYQDLYREVEDLHNFLGDSITQLAQTLMEASFKTN